MSFVLDCILANIGGWYSSAPDSALAMAKCCARPGPETAHLITSASFPPRKLDFHDSASTVPLFSTVQRVRAISRASATSPCIATVPDCPCNASSICCVPTRSPEESRTRKRPLSALLSSTPGGCEAHPLKNIGDRTRAAENRLGLKHRFLTKFLVNWSILSTWRHLHDQHLLCCGLHQLTGIAQPRKLFHGIFFRLLRQHHAANDNAH